MSSMITIIQNQLHGCYLWVFSKKKTKRKENIMAYKMNILLSQTKNPTANVPNIIVVCFN